jgi:hypothetical protein
MVLQACRPCVAVDAQWQLLARSPDARLREATTCAHARATDGPRTSEILILLAASRMRILLETELCRAGTSWLSADSSMSESRAAYGRVGTVVRIRP